MLLIRKIDLYTQAIIVMLLAGFLFFSNLFYVMGFFVLGIWQMASAIMNTRGFIIAGRMKFIFLYWLFVSLVLGLSFLAVKIPLTSHNTTDRILTNVAYCGALVTAVYYWNIYDRLVSFLEYKKEISGVLKS